MSKDYFVIGNKETGIFFKSSKLDKSKPIGDFYLFTSTREALIHGYLPCEKCNPLYFSDAPEFIKLFFEILKQQKYSIEKINTNLKNVNLWFMSEHNMSLKEYLDFIKANQNTLF